MRTGFALNFALKSLNHEAPIYFNYIPMNTIAIKLAALILLLSQFCPSLHANVVLWSKEFPAAASGRDGKYNVRVGQDGSVIVVDGPANTTSAKWYSRSGDLIKEFNIVPFYGYGVRYVSQHEVILIGKPLNEESKTNKIIDIYQLNSSKQLINTRLSTSVVASLSGMELFTYPYLAEWDELEGGGYKLTLRDLTLPEVYTVLGDAAIGVHGKNLRVRWKTVANTKYKVQRSTDTETWTDYTEIIDGNGATMVVSIPVDVNSGKVFARVIKL